VTELAADVIPRGRYNPAGTPQWSVPGVVFSSQGTTAYAINTDQFQPFLVSTPLVVDRLVTEVTGASGSAGSLGRLALYHADPSWQPTALVVDAGTHATDSTGVYALTVATTLLPGRYLTAQNSNGANATFRTYRGGLALSGGQIINTMGTNPLIQRVNLSRTFAAFPADGTAWTGEIGSTIGFVYTVLLRVAEL
jgi:hypothetical protein